MKLKYRNYLSKVVFLLLSASFESAERFIGTLGYLENLYSMTRFAFIVFLKIKFDRSFTDSTLKKRPNALFKTI